ncbi:MAG: 2-hydroxycyclohexanecarboxyl-CoA dehydrogenase [Kribbellaceae bacterium]|jgi:2-hydroxycyclohexanecarboxyl-CoA dehydrogenase|nr:2-hydroxycyclohexanecarboxyl-CoA dehydrogenase [Kribbellaceae bacterium]
MERRVALVTGAGSGINRAVALRLAQGAVIAVCDRNRSGADETVAMIRSHGGSATAWELDVTDRDAVFNVVKAIEAEHHRHVEILVNGAGFADKAPFLELTLERWRRITAVHLEGPFHLCQAVLPGMIEGQFGRLIGMGSLGAHLGNAEHEHYAAAKAGTIGFARSLAREFGAQGITANVVVPGLIQTPLLDGLPPEGYAVYANTLVGRIGSTEDVAAAVAYLASDEASFVTGLALHVNGGVYA